MAAPSMATRTTAAHRATPPSFEELRIQLSPPYEPGDVVNPRWLCAVIPSLGTLAAACYALTATAL